MLFRGIGLSPLKSGLIIAVLLITAIYYFEINPTQGQLLSSSTSQRGPSGYVLQPGLITENLASGQSAKPSLENVEATCSKHGFKAFQQTDSERPRRVYDIFPFLLELDWLEIRLRELAPYVDYFVIVEYSTTFTGLPNPVVYEENKDRFKEFESQILHFVVDDKIPKDVTDVWVHERFMKDAMLYETFPTFVGTEKEAKEGDVILISDVDEIPKPQTVTLLRHCDFPERLTLRSHFYYYSYQWLHRGEQWAHPQATTYHGVNGTINPQDLRRGQGGVNPSLFEPLNRWMQSANIWDAAWHCSSCFPTIAEVHKKMASFSHADQWNTPENRNPKTIADRVRHGIDLFGRWGQNYDRVDHNMDVPQYVLKNPERFRYLIDRDAEDAAFTDYYDLV